jgi:hypothetical protein
MFETGRVHNFYHKGNYGTLQVKVKDEEPITTLFVSAWPCADNLLVLSPVAGKGQLCKFCPHPGDIINIPKGIYTLKSIVTPGETLFGDWNNTIIAYSNYQKIPPVPPSTTNMRHQEKRIFRMTSMLGGAGSDVKTKPFIIRDSGYIYMRAYATPPGGGAQSVTFEIREYNSIGGALVTESILTLIIDATVQPLDYAVGNIIPVVQGMVLQGKCTKSDAQATVVDFQIGVIR